MAPWQMFPQACCCACLLGLACIHTGVHQARCTTPHHMTRLPYTCRMCPRTDMHLPRCVRAFRPSRSLSSREAGRPGSDREAANRMGRGQGGAEWILHGVRLRLRTCRWVPARACPLAGVPCTYALLMRCHHVVAGSCTTQMHACMHGCEAVYIANTVLQCRGAPLRVPSPPTPAFGCLTLSPCRRPLHRPLRPLTQQAVGEAAGPDVGRAGL